MSVTLERHADTLVAAKRSSEESRLEREAEILSKMQHPGLIEYVDFVDGDPAVLLTAWAGTDTWDRLRPETATEALAAMAAVSSTLNDLHEAGISHRGISPEHVIIASDGRPILCSLGDAGPADPDGRAADLAGVRDLVDHLAEVMTDTHAQPLRDLAARLRRPDATLGDVLRAAGSTAATTEAPKPRSAPRRSVVAGVGGVAALTAFAMFAGLGVAGPSHSSAGTGDTPEAPVESILNDAATKATTAPPEGPPDASPAPTTSRPAVQPTSPDRLAVDAAANVIEHDGRRYGLGSPDDVVVVGDWNCDGNPTPAILQASTGRVAVFNAWPDAGGSLRPSFNGQSADADSLMADHVGQCDVLRAVGPYGSTIITGVNP